MRGTVLSGGMCFITIPQSLHGLPILVDRLHKCQLPLAISPYHLPFATTFHFPSAIFGCGYAWLWYRWLRNGGVTSEFCYRVAVRESTRLPGRELHHLKVMKKNDRSGSKKGGRTDARSQRRTAAQRRARQHLGRFSAMWRELTQEQRTAWRLWAEETDRLVRQGQYYRLSGQQLFNKINSVLALCEHEPLTTPPPRPQFGPNPVGALTISRDADSLALKLNVSGTPSEDIMVFASPPQSAGRAYCGDYRFLGLLPAPVEHASDITRLYIKKYGVPPANTRIFIRAWQQIEGWECRGQMRLIEALVPARTWVLHGQRPSRTTGKKA
jgi:hypothetical protein